MHLTKRLGVVFVLLLLATSPPGFGQHRGVVSPEVLKQLEAEGEATFFVLLKESANLEPASEIRDWEARGEFVYRRLSEVAETTQAGLLEFLTAHDAEFESFWIVNTLLVSTGDEALVSQLAARAEVAEIRARSIVEIPEPVPGEESPRIESTEAIEWNIARVRADQVWSTYGVTGTGIVVANIDFGVQFDHPALVNQYRGNLGGGVFDHNYNWYDPTEACGSPSTAPCDTDGHGTRTMGIMVGDDEGTNKIGVAPGASWMAANLCDEWPPGPCFLDSALDAAQWFLAPTDLNGQNPQPGLRPHVVSSSWGAGSGDDWFQAAVQAWIASGIFPVFAAGNDGPSCGSLASPADYEESYAVGAFGSDNKLANWSSRGPSAFGPIKPDITAPGRSIRSSTITDDYASGGGTSFSAPHVSGAVALLWSGSPSLIGDIDGTKLFLDQAAIDDDPGLFSCGGDLENNNEWGEGRLDVLAAFEAAALIFSNGFESGDMSSWSNTVQ